MPAISQLTGGALPAPPAANDLIPIVNADDNTEAATGTTQHATYSDFLSPLGTAAYSDDADFDAAGVAQAAVDSHALVVGGAAHGAIGGTSKIAKLVSALGTAEFIFSVEETATPTGVYTGDLWVAAPAGAYIP